MIQSDQVIPLFFMCFRLANCDVPAPCGTLIGRCGVKIGSEPKKCAEPRANRIAAGMSRKSAKVEGNVKAT